MSRRRREGGSVGGRRFRWPWREPAEIDSEVDEEIAFHLDMRARELEREGMDPAAARAQALEEFGDVEAARRSLRGMDRTAERGRRRRDGLGQIHWDLRLGWRTLSKSPGFTAVAVLTLALGIGGNTALFSVLRAVVLQPLPYPDADRLVVLWCDLLKRDVREYASSPADLGEYRQADALAAVAGASGGAATLTGPSPEARPERIQLTSVTPGFLEVLGVAPLLGRPFEASDHATPDPDAAAAGELPPYMALLGHGLWQRRFGGNEGVLGASFELDGAEARVVGVMPPGFHILAAPGAPAAAPADLWVADRVDPDFRGAFYLFTVARLAPGATLAEAQAQLDAVSARQREQFANYEAAGSQVRVEPMLGDLTKEARPRVLALFGAVAFVLLIASLNVANLLLLRASTRRRELAVRAALGAHRGRLVRELLGESTLLALLGGAVGVGLAWLLLRLLQAFGPAELPRLADAAIDGPILAFSLVLTLVTALVFGTLPSLAATRKDLFRGLRQRVGGGGGVSEGRLRHGLVVVEVALSLVLLIGAGLMLRSLVALHRVDLGFEPEGVLTFELPIPFGKYPDGRSAEVLKRRLEERIAALPGVAAVGGTNGLPLGGYGGQAPYGSAAALADGDESTLRQANVRVVRPGYFEALGTRLLKGREFTPRDGELGLEKAAELFGAPANGTTVSGPPRPEGPVIVDRALAEQAWPGEDPIGQPLYLKVRVPGIWFEVVGVVESQRQTALVGDRPTAYLPDGFTGGAGTMAFAVRTGSDPASLVVPIREAIETLDREIPMDKVQPLAQTVSAAMAPVRFSLGLLSLFAAVALVLAVVGLYGVLAYAVRQRTTEIGVRLAFGATRGQILTHTVRHGLGLAAVGILLGTAAALGLTGFMRSLLVGISPTDPATFAALAALLLLVAAAACLLPALRATRVDPSGLLRAE